MKPLGRAALLRWGAPAVLAFAVSLAAQPAGAQPMRPPAQAPDEAAQSAARTLGSAALELYDKGDYAGALEKFDQAYALYHAPTLGLMAARCEAKLGRLVAAAARYLEVTAIALDAKASDAFRDAKIDAAKERAALMERIPKIIVVVEPPGDASVTVDGAALRPEELGVSYAVDPGDHQVEATRGAIRASSRVSLKQGETQRVALKFAPAEAPADDDPGASQRALGWVAAGVGAAGLVAGAILTGVAASQRGDLDSSGCVDRACPPDLEADVDSYNTARIASGAGFIAGGALLAAGAVLIFTAPSRPPSSPTSGRGPTIQPRVGWASVGVGGTF